MASRLNTDLPEISRLAINRIETVTMKEKDLFHKAIGAAVTAAKEYTDTEITNIGPSGLENVVEDLTPQLGGDLDVNGQAIVSVSGGDIPITPDGAGKIVLDGLNWPTADGSNGQVIQTDGAGNLTFASVAAGGATDFLGLTDTPGSYTADYVVMVNAGGTALEFNDLDTEVTNLGFIKSAPGGGLNNVVEDLTPQLGGNLDVNGNAIVSVSGGDIPITPDGAGQVIIDGMSWPTSDGSNDWVLTTDGAGNMSWTAKTASGTGISDIVEDVTPQLGGNLDINGFDIVSVSNTDINITPNGTGSIVLDGLNWPQSDGTNGQVLTTDGAGNLSWTTPSGGGVTDHGALTGLGDDDHPQYHNDARGDARYYTQAQVDALIPDVPTITISTSGPSGGSDGDLWFRYL